MPSNASVLSKLLRPGGEIVTETGEAASQGTSTYATPDALPLTGNNTGDTAFVESTDRLYIWNGSGWYNIALINTAPSITGGGAGSYELALDGTPTVITLVAEDPEGIPITWSYSVTSGSLGNTATVSQADNVFTITPSTSDTDIGDFTITFTASDGVNIATDVNSFSLSFLSPLWDETVLSIGTSSTDGLNNSTFIDRSTNAHTVTPTGTPIQTAFHPYLDYYSANFTEDTITIPTSSEFNVGSGDFTFETWINTTRNDGTIFDHGGNYLHTYNGMRCGFTAGSGFKYTINRQSNSASGEFNLQATTPINDGEWHHIRACRSGSTFRIFIDGVLDASSAISVTGYQPASVFVVGGALSNNVSTSGLTGNLFNFRLIKGTALNTTDDSFDPPTENLTAVPGTSLLLFNDRKFVDKSSTSHSLTLNGNPAISAFNPFGQGSEYAVGENKGSVYNDAVEDCLSLKLDTDIVLSHSQSWTVECWVYLNHMPSHNEAIIFSQYNASSSQRYFVGCNTDGGSLKVRLFNGGNWIFSDPIKYKEWVHVAVCHTANLGDELFVNGVSAGTLNYSGIYNDGVWIMSLNNGVPAAWQGYISDFKYTEGSVVYSEDFTPPTQPDPSGAEMYLPFDNAGIFDKTGNHTLTLFGDTSTSTTQTKFADTAIYFDGSDYIQTGNILLPATDDFTVETWVYPNSSGTPIGLLGQYSSSNAATRTTFYIDSSNINAFAGGNIMTTSISIDAWSHVAWVRESGTDRLYVNGVLGTTGTLGTIEQVNTEIGRYNFLDREFLGYIENFQILRGLAKYTTNFTPPTRTQGRTFQAES